MSGRDLYEKLRESGISNPYGGGGFLQKSVPLLKRRGLKIQRKSLIDQIFKNNNSAYRLESKVKSFG